MSGALERVRKELGRDAVIESARSLTALGGPMRWLRRPAVRITAHVREPAGTAPPVLGGTVVPIDEPASGSVSRSERAAPHTTLRATPTPSTGAKTGPHLQQSARAHPQAERARAPIASGSEPSLRATEAVPRDSPSEPSNDDLRVEIAEIRTLLASLVGSARFHGAGDGASGIHHFLLARGIDAILARSLVHRTVAELDPAALADLDRLKLALASRMRADLVKAERRALPGRVQVFVGPSGVGKTTTVAKLAARVARSAPGRVLAITTDDRRVAALEQLRARATGFDVDVEIAASASDVRRIVASAPDCERIFVDTPGRSPRDPAHRQHLQALADELDEVELFLVHAATSRASDSREIIDSYSRLPWSRLVITRVDQTRVYGELYNAVVRSGRPIAALGTGPAVPGDLESADLAGILRRVLHG